MIAPQMRCPAPLSGGNHTVAGDCALVRRSRTVFDADMTARIVKRRKHGRRTDVAGPVARRYIAVEPVE